MIVEYIRYTIPADRRDAFERGYAEAGRALDTSAHCLAYELARCAEDATQYVLRIEWDSAEGHLQGFRRSPQFRPFFAAIGPFVNDISEMRHYELTSVVGCRAPQSTTPS